MADIRCSHCGKNNPDFFDVCQFCQSPLKSESMLHAGEIPSEKDTGELEPILPEWLQDARQQNRESVEDESFSPGTKPKAQSSEPLDLLAGLAAQDDSSENEVPDWLASINPIDDKKASLSSVSDKREEPSDFFAQFSQNESEPSTLVPGEPAPMGDDNITGVAGLESSNASQGDELRDWFSQNAVEPGQTFTFDQGGIDTEDNSWMNNLGSSEPSKPETPVEKEAEDLSWLHDLEAASRQTGDLPSQKADTGFDFPSSQPESSQEDLSWLNNLGGTSEPTIEESLPAQPGSTQEDLSWLNNLGGSQEPTIRKSLPAQPESSQEDLSWLNNLGGTPEPTIEESLPAQPGSAQEDLSWLNDLGSTPSQATEESSLPKSDSLQEDLSWLDNLVGTLAPEPVTDKPASVQPDSSQDDLSWMKNLVEEQSSQTEKSPSDQYSPPGTAPLDKTARYDSTPDWLKSAMEEPSMPAPGELSMEWFTEREKAKGSEETPEMEEISDIPIDTPEVSTQWESTPVSPIVDFSSSDSPTPSSQDVEDMFNIEMPDWVSQESDSLETSHSETAVSSASGDSLAPVELPSWVQAMRPVDSAIAGTTTFGEDQQEAETEGPLAGFQGVIPSAPIGSSLRPKAFSLKLQVTDEQQAGALLIEQIIASETTAHPPIPTKVVASQRTLRWILSGLFIVLLGLVIGLGSQIFAIIPPGMVSGLSNLVGTIPDGSPVLLVMDYEPAVAGELAAAAGPVLDQLALTRHSTFTFLSMSPNGPAMVEHVMLNAKISRPVPDGGLGYETGFQYFNAGFLPGGSAGVLGFIDDPVKMMPDAVSLASVGSFSNFEAVIVLTDNPDSGRVWVEQLELAKQTHPEIGSKPLIIVSSAQVGPMFEPYVSSGQVDVLINGLSDAANYEYVNQSRPGIARAYWDSFGIGLMIAILSIVLGNFWNIFMSIREQRLEAEHG